MDIGKLDKSFTVKLLR